MALPPSGSKIKIVSDCVTVKFDVGGKSYCLNQKHLPAFIAGMQASADKASLLFTEVVVARSYILSDSDHTGNHQLSMWHCKGPLTLGQIQSILNYPKGILSTEWFAYMNSFNVNASSPVLLKE